MSALVALGPSPVVVGASAYRSRDGGLFILVSEDEINGARYTHISVSRKSRTPSYEDLALVKDELVGPDRPAYQVFPRAVEHRNLSSTCLHLWAPVDKDPFPDPLGERADAVAPVMFGRRVG